MEAFSVRLAPEGAAPAVGCAKPCMSRCAGGYAGCSAPQLHYGVGPSARAAALCEAHTVAEDVPKGLAALIGQTGETGVLGQVGAWRSLTVTPPIGVCSSRRGSQPYKFLVIRWVL